MTTLILDALCFSGLDARCRITAVASRQLFYAMAPRIPPRYFLTARDVDFFRAFAPGTFRYTRTMFLCGSNFDNEFIIDLVTNVCSQLQSLALERNSSITDALADVFAKHATIVRVTCESCSSITAGFYIRLLAHPYEDVKINVARTIGDFANRSLLFRTQAAQAGGCEALCDLIRPNVKSIQLLSESLYALSKICRDNVAVGVDRLKLYLPKVILFGLECSDANVQLEALRFLGRATEKGQEAINDFIEEHFPEAWARVAELVGRRESHLASIWCCFRLVCNVAQSNPSIAGRFFYEYRLFDIAYRRSLTKKKIKCIHNHIRNDDDESNDDDDGDGGSGSGSDAVLEDSVAENIVLALYWLLRNGAVRKDDFRRSNMFRFIVKVALMKNRSFSTIFSHAIDIVHLLTYYDIEEDAGLFFSRPQFTELQRVGALPEFDHPGSFWVRGFRREMCYSKIKEIPVIMASATPSTTWTAKNRVYNRNKISKFTEEQMSDFNPYFLTRDEADSVTEIVASMACPGSRNNIEPDRNNINNINDTNIDAGSSSSTLSPRSARLYGGLITDCERRRKASDVVRSEVGSFRRKLQTYVTTQSSNNNDNTGRSSTTAASSSIFANLSDFFDEVDVVDAEGQQDQHLQNQNHQDDKRILTNTKQAEILKNLRQEQVRIAAAKGQGILEYFVENNFIEMIFLLVRDWCGRPVEGDVMSRLSSAIVHFLRLWILEQEYFDEFAKKNPRSQLSRSCSNTGREDDENDDDENDDQVDEIIVGSTNLSDDGEFVCRGQQQQQQRRNQLDSHVLSRGDVITDQTLNDILDQEENLKSHRAIRLAKEEQNLQVENTVTSFHCITSLPTSVSMEGLSAWRRDHLAQQQQQQQQQQSSLLLGRTPVRRGRNDTLASILIHRATGRPPNEDKLGDGVDEGIMKQKIKVGPFGIIKRLAALFSTEAELTEVLTAMVRITSLSMNRRDLHILLRYSEVQTEQQQQQQQQPPRHDRTGLLEVRDDDDYDDYEDDDYDDYEDDDEVQPRKPLETAARILEPLVCQMREAYKLSREKMM